MNNPTPAEADPALAAVVAYHERTKHHLHRYAAALGYLDWASQPDPFRTFAGAAVTPLPLTADALDAAYADLYVPGAIAPRPLTLETVGAFCELALGLSAWKQAGRSRWALRCNPSSGNLHPTEGYLVCRAIPELPGGVHHYVSHDHALERRCAAAPPLPEGCFLFGLSSIHWREAWKYGERAYRYCQHDAGHALAAARYAAAALGWSALLLEAPADADVAALLGLDRDPDFTGAEREHPDALLAVGPPPLTHRIDLDALVVEVRAGHWTGRANRLSAEHHPWPIIDAVAEAAAKPRTAAPEPRPTEAAPLRRTGSSTASGGPSASAIIRRRRSAVDFDGITGIPAEAFYHILRRAVSIPQHPAPGTRHPPRRLLPSTRCPGRRGSTPC